MQNFTNLNSSNIEIVNMDYVLYTAINKPIKLKNIML